MLAINFTDSVCSHLGALIDLVDKPGEQATVKSLTERIAGICGFTGTQISCHKVLALL